MCSTLCIAECERWRRADNVSADNGIFYPVSSLAECMDLCLVILSCVAIDVWQEACSLHINATDLLSRQETIGVSQYVLDRACAVSTALPTSMKTFFTTPLTTTGLSHTFVLTYKVLRCSVCSIMNILYYWFNVYDGK